MQEMLEVVEKEKIPPVILPESVTQPVREANQRIAEKYFSPEAEKSPPIDAVLVLERSGVLPASSVVAEFQKRDVKVVFLPIGKVLPLMFSEFDGRWDEEDLDLADAKQAEAFKQWIKTSQDPTVRMLRKTLKEILEKPKRLLVLDDAQASGETLTQTLPLVLEALSEHTHTLENELFYKPSFKWETTIFENADLELNPAELQVMTEILKGGIDLRRIKLELDSGWYREDWFKFSEENRAKLRDIIISQYRLGQTLLPIGVNGALTLLGLQAMQEAEWRASFKAEENPGEKLLQRFGFQGLQILKTSIEQQFAAIPVLD